MIFLMTSQNYDERHGHVSTLSEAWLQGFPSGPM
jgi:hypothetical protein